MSKINFNTISEAIEDIKNGKMIIVVDDEDRENEGDLLMAAEKADNDSINFMATHGRGLICVPMENERLETLGIPKMTNINTDPKETAFTVSVDSVDCTTGISALERANTILKLVDQNATGQDFNKPGHIFPLGAKTGGVLRRAGHTEAAVDLARIAGLYPAGVICEIMNDDGSMARVKDLVKYKEKHGLKMITIADLIAYRMKNDSYIKRISQAEMPTKYGDFKIIGYQDTLNDKEHVALVKGDITEDEAVLVRVHSECLTGDVFGSLRCDCGIQLGTALEAINKVGKGILLYLRQEGRGIGLVNKIKAYNLQDGGLDTVEANIALGFEEDLRDYGVGAQILADIGAKKINLMTNNPKKLTGLSGYGLELEQRASIDVGYTKDNAFYLKTKCEKMGHMIKVEEDNNENL